MFYAKFKNRDQECFGCSLANYFDAVGESSLAEEVYSEFRKHPFVAPDGGVNPYLCTRIITDVTSGKYDGVLRYGKETSRDALEKELKKDFGIHADSVAQAIKEEKDFRRLVGGYKEIHYSGRAILIQAREKSSHCMVALDTGDLIDNGELHTILNPEKFFLTIWGVLKIYPKGFYPKSLMPSDFTECNNLLESILDILSRNAT